MLKLTKMLSALLAVTILAVGAPSAMAQQTYTWTGTTDNDYFTDGNWDLAGTPAHLDDVVIDSGTPEVGDIIITTTDWNDSWWGQWEGAGRARGGKTVALSNGTMTSTGSLFVGYGGTATWTQTGGALIAGTLNIGGYDYDAGAGSGTFILEDGSVELGGYVHFQGGTQLFDQSGGSVTGDRIDLNPSWHQPVNGSYDMTGGELTLTGADMITEGGESGTAWAFNFGGGDIYLGGDQSTIADDDARFIITGDAGAYRAEYDDGSDITHLYYLTGTPGDLDGDGDVDDVDLGLFEGQFGSQAPGTYTADFDGDEDVDLDDYLVMRNNIGAGAVAPQGAAIPEPASAALLVLGLSAVIRRRRHRSCR